MPKPAQIGAVAGITAPIVAFACILTAIALYPPFSWTNNALSDLGVVEGATSIIFNVGLITAGVLAFVFAVLGVYSYVGKRVVGKAGVAVFAAATVALVCIGIFNEHFVPTHYLVSVAFFVLAPIGFFILTCAFWLDRRRGLAVFSLVLGLIAALPWVLEFTIYYAPNVAIPETVSALAFAAWAIVLSRMILSQKR
ncbi:MAG: DUF998 domain-containing protein [Candidatus Bathyarchaeia archaeon]|jgi:hypothetical membrane protein